MSGFNLQRQGRGWIVAGPGGRQLSGVYGDRNLAAARLGELADLAEWAELAAAIAVSLGRRGM